MLFLLAIWDFYYHFGSILHLLIFWIAFIGIQLLEDVMVPKKTEF